MSTIFSKIIAGEIPGRFVYRDDTVVAFLDISPLKYGHTLVVPVAEVDHWIDLDPAIWAHVNEVAQWVGQAQQTIFDNERVGMMIVGFDVPHTHVHVFPVDSMQDYSATPIANPDSDKMDEIEQRLRDEVARIAAKHSA